MFYSMPDLSTEQGRESPEWKTRSEIALFPDMSTAGMPR
jgi:hypothetical protein